MSLARRGPMPLSAWLNQADERTAKRKLESILARRRELEERERLRTLEAEPDPEMEALRAGPVWRRLEWFLRDEKGEPLRLARIHHSWLDFVGKAHAAGLHAGILAPFGHGKTTVLVVGLVLDWIGQNINGRFQIVSANDQIATKRVSSIKAYIERSPEYQRLYPWVRRGDDRNWQKHEITVERDSFSPDPTLQAYGVLSGGTGSRSDGTVFDDVDDLQSLGAATREARAEAVDSVWITRLANAARAVMPATAWHEEDTAHRKIRSGGWAWIVQAVSATNHAIRSVEVYGGKSERDWNRARAAA